MRTIRNIAVIAIAAIAFALLAPGASAEIPIQKIRVTVSAPVEVPNLVLPIGTYVFEALENGRVTRILSGDESHIYTTLLTQPEERREPMDSTVVSMIENPKGQVPRIDSWFFAGESIGSEFLYAGVKAKGVSSSRLDAFAKDTGHYLALAAEDLAEAPEYAAVRVERAVVGSSEATGPFFRANSLVN